MDLFLADIKEIVEALKIEANSRGLEVMEDMKDLDNNIMVTCPFHADGKERKPSCGISKYDYNDGSRLYEAGTVHCFTCGYTAQLPIFVSNVLGYDDLGKFGHVWLIRNFDSFEVKKQVDIAGMFDDMFNIGEEETLEGTFITDTELAKYRFIHPYMYERGLTDNIIEYFDVGYDTETDCLTFPVCNKDGNCMFLQRRSVSKKYFHNDKDVDKAATLYGIDKVWEQIEWVKQLGYVEIVESPIDALTLWKYGSPALGTMQALPSSRQIALINELPIQMVISSQDNDEAGQRGAQRLREGVKKLVHRRVFPFGVKDINDMTYEQYRLSTTTIVY